jgi:hypothetical protein
VSITVSGACDQYGQCTLYGRFTAKDATGVVANPGEGPCVKQTDLTALWFSLISLTDTPDRIIVTPTQLPISKVIFDTLQTSANDGGYKGDAAGFNFRYTIIPNVLNAGGRSYRASVRVVTTGGGVGNGIWNITTRPVDIGPQSGDTPPCDELPYE